MGLFCSSLACGEKQLVVLQVMRGMKAAGSREVKCTTKLMEEWEVEPEIPVKQLEYGIALAPLFVRILYAVSDSESSPFLPKNQSSSPASRLVDIRNPSKLQDSCNINI